MWDAQHPARAIIRVESAGVTDISYHMVPPVMSLEIIPVRISREIIQDEKLEDLIKSKVKLCDGDIVVVSQKIISKQEGRIMRLSLVIPSLLSVGIASEYRKDPRLVEVILSESKRIVRMQNGVIIVETNGGFVCANAGVDQSNLDDDLVALLPEDPDASAARLRGAILEKTGRQVAVIISDTFGRPFRMGQTDCAIGVSGIDSILDYAGTTDTFGNTLRVTAIAVSDEMCGAAELVCNKATNTPIAVIRNYKFSAGTGSARDLLRPKAVDLFR